MRCAEEIPLVRAIGQRYKDKGLVVIWVSHQDRIEKLNKYAKDHNVPDYVFDPDDSVSRKFGMTYGGGVVFVNSGGIVKSRVPKGISAKSLDDELNKIL